MLNTPLPVQLVGHSGHALERVLLYDSQAVTCSLGYACCAKLSTELQFNPTASGLFEQGGKHITVQGDLLWCNMH